MGHWKLSHNTTHSRSCRDAQRKPTRLLLPRFRERTVLPRRSNKRWWTLFPGAMSWILDNPKSFSFLVCVLFEMKSLTTEAGTLRCELEAMEQLIRTKTYISMTIIKTLITWNQTWCCWICLVLMIDDNNYVTGSLLFFFPHFCGKVCLNRLFSPFMMSQRDSFT